MKTYYIGSSLNTVEHLYRDCGKIKNRSRDVYNNERELKKILGVNFCKQCLKRYIKQEPLGYITRNQIQDEFKLYVYKHG